MYNSSWEDADPLETETPGKDEWKSHRGSREEEKEVMEEVAVKKRPIISARERGQSITLFVGGWVQKMSDGRYGFRSVMLVGGRC